MKRIQKNSAILYIRLQLGLDLAHGQTENCDMECTRNAPWCDTKRKQQQQKHILMTTDRIYSPQYKHRHQEDDYTQACVGNEDVQGSYADLLQQAGHQ